jgi:ubiquinone/menaquinone biosynthesis C-methylase UbiE
MTQWFEDESFWQEFYQFMFSEERFNTASEEVTKILERANFSGTKVLDLCCGPGRHAVELAKQNLQVTGMDKSNFLLNKAKEYAEQNEVEVSFIEEDMRNLNLPDSFDLIINIYTSFGYFEDKNEDLLVLKNIYHALKKGGTFLIDVMGKEVLAKIYQNTMSERVSEDYLFIGRPSIEDNWSRVKNEWMVIKNGKCKEYRFIHTIYSGQELKGLLETAGFKNIKLFGSFEGDEYGIDAKRLIATGVK